jgi:hypothetical protein
VTLYMDESVGDLLRQEEVFYMENFTGITVYLFLIPQMGIAM